MQDFEIGFSENRADRCDDDGGVPGSGPQRGEMEQQMEDDVFIGLAWGFNSSGTAAWRKVEQQGPPIVTLPGSSAPRPARENEGRWEGGQARLQAGAGEPVKSKMESTRPGHRLTGVRCVANFTVGDRGSATRVLQFNVQWGWLIRDEIRKY